ncbi:GLPGLI family protein [Pedobacter miscanthi]|uniref:GLPGLI family protein n=1 Tax=Pedobacter miscanthi TaxID=2259170 RepID=UPI00292DC336|nr:GLPGLI family protein [Pedobacter miscanthi]
MKHIFFITTLILSISWQAKAQNHPKESIVLNVIYQVVHINNLNDRDNPTKTDMVLSVGKNSSRYVKAEIYNRSLIPIPKAAPGMKMMSGTPIVKVNKEGGIISETYFQWPAENRLDINASIGNKDYSTNTALTKINWKIVGETKKIGDFDCQKAVGDFGGRTYTAWFAADLPFRNGPFKLWGLPGLILEAEDSKKEVRFLFKDINKETDSAKKVEPLGSKPIKISTEDYIKAKKAYQENPDAYMQSQLPVGSSKVRKYKEDSGDDSKKFLPNPIEL